MTRTLINAIVYTEFDDTIGPNPIFVEPTTLPENIQMLVAIKTITLLSGDQGIIPESLIILPFPSIKLKGLVKYIEREDRTRRGNIAQSAITFLFKESDDAIFYKYMEHLNKLFAESVRKIIEFENHGKPKEKIFEELKLLRESIIATLKELRAKALIKPDLRAFPEKKNGKAVDFKFKLVVCGDPYVGKTSTILRFTDNAFNRVYLPTMGVQISDKSFLINNYVSELIIWDIAGHNKFETMRKHFYQGADGIILIYDITNKSSFESIKYWYKDITKYLPNIKIKAGILIGNKLDLKSERKVTKQMGSELAREFNFELIEASALTGKNIEYAFYKLNKHLIKLKSTPRMIN